MHLKIYLSIASVLIFGCKVESFKATKDQNAAIFDAIKEGRVQDLGVILDRYQVDMNEKPFTIEYDDCEIMASPLELAIGCQNPEILSLIIDKNSLTIDIDTFDFVFQLNCLECFDFLLDHSRLTWSFIRELFERILKFFPNDENFFAYVSKLSKRVGFNDQLALIECSFYICTDLEKISLTVDASILAISRREILNEYHGKYERIAVISFVRAMIFKKDYVDLLPWIDSLYYQYPEADNNNMLIDQYKEYINHVENRVEEYIQPEEIIEKDGIDLYFKISESIRNGTQVDGMRVFLKLLNKNNRRTWSLLEKSPSIEELRREMNCALDFAIGNYLSEYVELLFEAGFEYSLAIDFSPMTENTIDTIKILLKNGVDINIFFKGRNTFLTVAASFGSIEVVEFLLRNGADPNLMSYDKYGNENTPLMLAAENLSVPVVKVLLENGAHPNPACVGGGRTPMSYAISYWATVFKPMKEDELLEIIELLFKHDADPNFANSSIHPPLIMAARNGLGQIMALLLKRGASPNFTSSNVKIFTIQAAIDGFKNEDERLAIIELLLAFGADPNAGNRGRKPLQLAIIADSFPLVKLLLENGADPDSTNDCLIQACLKRSFNIIEILLKYGTNTNAVDSAGNTPLSTAAGYYDKGPYFFLFLRMSKTGNHGSAELVKLLLDHGADPNGSHQQHRLLTTCAMFLDVDIATLLLEYGANPNVVDSAGKTPLIEAVRNCSIELVEILLKKNADPNFVYTASEEAYKINRYDIALVIERNNRR